MDIHDFFVNLEYLTNYNSILWYLNQDQKRIVTSKGKPDQRQHDNKNKFGNTRSLKPSVPKKK